MQLFSADVKILSTALKSCPESVYNVFFSMPQAVRTAKNGKSLSEIGLLFLVQVINFVIGMQNIFKAKYCAIPIFRIRNIFSVPPENLTTRFCKPARTGCNCGTHNQHNNKTGGHEKTGEKKTSESTTNLPYARRLQNFTNRTTTALQYSSAGSYVQLCFFMHLLLFQGFRAVV